MLVRPRVAVLLAAWNGVDWLSEQVNSILGQAGVDVEIFISVDSSTDGTEDLACSIAESHTNVHVLPLGFRFGGAAPNFFRLFRDVDIDSFDCVALSDQDDVWLPEKLMRAYNVMHMSNCDVVSSDVIAFWPGGKRKLIIKSFPVRKYDHFFEAAGPGCTYVFNQESAKAFKNFLIGLGDKADLVSLHDWLAYAFCREYGFRWVVDNVPLMLYRQHANNQVGTNDGFKAFKKRVNLISGGWYRTQVELIMQLVSPGKAVYFLERGYMMKNYKELRRRSRDRYFLLLMLVCRVF